MVARFEPVEDPLKRAQGDRDYWRAASERHERNARLIRNAAANVLDTKSRADVANAAYVAAHAELRGLVGMPITVGQIANHGPDVANTER